MYIKWRCGGMRLATVIEEDKRGERGRLVAKRMRCPLCSESERVVEFQVYMWMKDYYGDIKWMWQCLSCRHVFK